MELKHSAQKHTRDNRKQQHIRELAFANECSPFHKACFLKQIMVAYIKHKSLAL
jgi:hypothetical protein